MKTVPHFVADSILRDESSALMIMASVAVMINLSRQFNYFIVDSMQTYILLYIIDDN